MDSVELTKPNNSRLMISVAKMKDLEKIITSQTNFKKFRKKQQDWYSDTDDYVEMINLQKDDFGFQARWEL